MESLSADEGSSSSLWSLSQGNRTYRVDRLDDDLPKTRSESSIASDVKEQNPQSRTSQCGQARRIINPAIIVEKCSSISLHQGVSGGESRSKTSLVSTVPTPVRHFSSESACIVVTQKQSLVGDGGEHSGTTVQNQSSVPSESVQSDRCKRVRDIVLTRMPSENSSSGDDSEPQLTAWEKWFIEKEKQLREKAEARKNMEMEKRLEEEMLEQKKQDKLRREKLNWQLWLQKKKEEELQKLLEEQKRKEDDDIRKMRELELRRRAVGKYKEWLAQKEEEKKAEELRKKLLAKKQEEQSRKKQEKSAKAYQEWREKSKDRPVTPPVSYGFVGGTRIRYTDFSRCPAPNYVNPIPWVHPDVDDKR